MLPLLTSCRYLFPVFFVMTRVYFEHNTRRIQAVHCFSCCPFPTDTKDFTRGGVSNGTNLTTLANKTSILTSSTRNSTFVHNGNMSVTNQSRSLPTVNTVMDKNGSLNETDTHVDNHTTPIVTSIPSNASFSKNMTSTSSIVKPTQPSSDPDCELSSLVVLTYKLAIWIFKGQQCNISATRVRYGVFDIMAQENLPTIESVQNWTNWTEWTSLAQFGPPETEDVHYFFSQPDTHPSNKTAYIQYKFGVGNESDRSSHTFVQPVGFYSHSEFLIFISLCI